VQRGEARRTRQRHSVTQIAPPRPVRDNHTTPKPDGRPHARTDKGTHAPWVAILRWNRSTAGTAAAPICALAPAKRGRVPDHPAARTSPLLRPTHAPQGRESARRAEARRGLTGTEGELEERDLRRRRALAALYMDGEGGRRQHGGVRGASGRGRSISRKPGAGCGGLVAMADEIWIWLAVWAECLNNP
jgi:hypothetical protein